MTSIQSLLVLCALACLSLVTCQVAPNPPPIWPAQFQARFGESLVETTDPSIVNETSMFYYNIDCIGQLITYPTRCPVSPKATGGSLSGCDILFVESGIYLNQPDEGIDCCQLFPGVGPTPRNFTRGFTWQGVQSANDFFGNPHQCDFYASPQNEFMYWTELNTHHDIAFHDGGGSNWAWDHLNVTAQDPSIFNLFSDNATCSKACGSSEAELSFMQQNARTHSLIQLALHHHQLEQMEKQQQKDSIFVSEY